MRSAVQAVWPKMSLCTGLARKHSLRWQQQNISGPATREKPRISASGFHFAPGQRLLGAEFSTHGVKSHVNGQRRGRAGETRKAATSQRYSAIETTWVKIGRQPPYIGSLATDTRENARKCDFLFGGRPPFQPILRRWGSSRELQLQHHAERWLGLSN